MDFFPRPYYYYNQNRYIDPRYRREHNLKDEKSDYERFNNRDISKNIHIEEKSDGNRQDQVFEIFGIRLHFDDILIISLIFFLYNEGVRDNLLFVSLLLILLS